ncbi:MAG: efflux RND transporter periplasmic adaptor subunit [Gemmatimonadales bacterium]|nr:efflux RND transporter periplasmic adaptor subunit [Gemmatimonadales bacterium]
MMRWNVGAAAAMMVSACGGAPRAEPASAAVNRTAPGALATVDTATVDAPLALPGQLYVENDAVIVARSVGLVEAITVDLGSSVAAGQLLARLESTDQAIALARATEAAENAKRIVVRQRALAAAGGATAAELEHDESEFRAASIQLQQAQRNFALTRVVAPFSGVVTARMARARRVVGLGDSLFRVTAAAPLLVSVRVPETSVDGIRVGARASVSGLRGATAGGRVIRASPALDAASGTREVVLQVDHGARLMPGSSVTVKLGAERRQVVTMPRQAVAEEGYALVWANDRTTLRAVTLGADLGNGRVEVVSGLSPGETVVRSGK